MQIYYKYRDVPFDITYPSAWRMRGYRVKDGSVPIARLITHFDDIKSNLPLYGLSQTKRLMGSKARRRRQAYISALYGEEEDK